MSEINDKSSLIQQQVDAGSVDEDLNLKTAVCSECSSPQPEDKIAADLFYNSGMSPSCRFCGGVVVIVPEALAGTPYLKNRFDQMRGIDTTGYIPGVTAE